MKKLLIALALVLPVVSFAAIRPVNVNGIPAGEAVVETPVLTGVPSTAIASVFLNVKSPDGREVRVQKFVDDGATCYIFSSSISCVKL